MKRLGRTSQCLELSCFCFSIWYEISKFKHKQLFIDLYKTKCFHSFGFLGDLSRRAENAVVIA